MKEEFKIVERKGLTQTLDFSNVFKIEWLRIVFNRIHDGFLWLDNGPINIIKRIIHRVIGYPTLDLPKMLRSDSKETIEKNIGVV